MPAPAFFGHERIASSLWRMVAERRLPQTLLFAGPKGVGKSTLARHLAAGINCAAGPGRPCGDCSPCERILAADLSREEHRSMLADRRKLAASKREKDPLVIATHPDFLLFPPDGPSRVFSIHQARFLRSQARSRPMEGRRRVFVIRRTERANEHAANALLKTLEEPASNLTIVLTSERPYQLLPTIRSRSIPFFFAALAPSEMEAFLRTREEVPAGSRQQVSAWSRGSPGVAITIDMEEFRRRRGAMLQLVRVALSEGGFARLSGELEAIARRQAEGIDRLAWMASTLLRDLLRLHLDMREDLTHLDIESDLQALAPRASFAWVERALERLSELERLEQTNIQKQIAFEAYALSLQDRRARE